MADRGRGRGGPPRGRGDGGGGRGRGRGGGDRGGGGLGRGGGRGGAPGGYDSGPPRGGYDGNRGGRGGFGNSRGGRGGFAGGGQSAGGVFGNGTFPEPDLAVTKLEDLALKDPSVALASLSLTDALPRRPGYGTLGRKVILWTNYFKLQGINAKTELFRYTIAFQPEGEIPKPKRKRMIQLLLQRAPFKDATCATDWAQTLITTTKLDLGAARQAYEIEWYPADGEPIPAPTPDEPESRKASRRRNTRKLLVEFLAALSIDELVKDISFSIAGGTYPARGHTIQALNIILSHGPSIEPNVAALNQKYYPFGEHAKTLKFGLGSGLDALRGYFSSVRTSVNRILVNVNVATAAFYQSGPLLDVMTSFNNGPPTNPEQHRRIVSFVKKLRFETNYIVDKGKDGKPQKDKAGKPLTKRKVHTIANLSPFNKNATNTSFKLTNPNGQSQTITVQQYFNKEYNINLQVPNAPLVNYGTDKDPKWVPAELCSILPGQTAKRMLRPDQTRNMIEFAARSPVENAESIVQDGIVVTHLSVAHGSAFLKQFGIQVDTTMLTVNGRILDPPTLQYKGKSLKPREGKWNLTVGPFNRGAMILSWGCIVVNDGGRPSFENQAHAADVLGRFRLALLSYGLTIPPLSATGLRPVTVNRQDIQNRNANGVWRALHQGITEISPKPALLFVILPGDNAFLYDCLKYLCDIKLGVPSICSIGKKFTKDKGQSQYFGNVALKFNLKNGGVNHLINPQELSPLDDRTIVFGIDVTHPSPGSSETSPSIAGVVASCETTFTQYPASIRTQKGRKEMVSDLADMIVERLKYWQSLKKQLPTKVIVYRDGVSEGQFPIVLAEEYPQFVKAFERLYGARDKHPKISIITVGKRHHTRFYPTKKEEADGRSGNPMPGTVVDRGVTGERLFDFYLLAHQGLQGTSKPCHYVVLKDENKLGADQLQKLTHNLCYTFGRATRSVSLCPPAYYADLLCERGRSYLHNVLKGEGSEAFTQDHWQGGVHAALQNTMFYL